MQVWKKILAFFIEHEKFLLLSIKSGLRIIYLDADEGMDVRLPFKKKGRIQGVDYDPVSRMIYWADSSDDGYIMRAHLNESRKRFFKTRKKAKSKPLFQ